MWLYIFFMLPVAERSSISTRQLHLSIFLPPVHPVENWRNIGCAIRKSSLQNKDQDYSCALIWRDVYSQRVSWLSSVNSYFSPVDNWSFLSCQVGRQYSTMVKVFSLERFELKSESSTFHRAFLGKLFKISELQFLCLNVWQMLPLSGAWD